MASSDARAVALIIEFNFVCLTLAIILCSLAWWGLVLRIWHPRNLSPREMLGIFAVVCCVWFGAYFVVLWEASYSIVCIVMCLWFNRGRLIDERV